MHWIQDGVCQRGVGRLTNKLPAKMMTKQLGIVPVESPPRRSWKTIHKKRVNAKSLGSKMVQPHRAKKNVTRFFEPIKTVDISGELPRDCFMHFFLLNPLYQ